MQHTTGDGNVANEAQRRNTWDRDGTNRAMAPPLAVAGAECGGKGDAIGGRRRGVAESTCCPIILNAMAKKAAPPGQ